MKFRETVKYSVFLIPLLFLLPLFFIPLQKSLSIFPWEQRVYETGTYADTGGEAAGNASTIDYFKVGADSITLAYTLRDGEIYAYAGMYFSTTVNKTFNDLSGYDYLKLKLAASVRDAYQITIKTQIDGHTNEGNPNTRCPLEKALVLEDYMNEYIIPLTEFEFLDWWFDRQQLEPADYNPHQLLKKTAQINIQKTKQIPDGTEEQGRVIVKELSFHKSFALIYILAGSCFLIALAAVTIAFFKTQARKRQNADVLQLGYTPIGLTSYTDEDTQRLTALIMNNYTDPDMSVERLYKETGLSRQRIAVIIRKKYRITFKQLLNKIRLTEAARLLKETDRNITEIAVALGFSSSSYFFQVFKAAYKVSPTDFRKQNRTAGI